MEAAGVLLGEREKLKMSPPLPRFLSGKIKYYNLFRTEGGGCKCPSVRKGITTNASVFFNLCVKEKYEVFDSREKVTKEIQLLK